MDGCRTLAGLLLHAAEGVPDEAIDRGRLCLLDWVACTVAGARDPIGRAILDHVTSSDSGTACTLVGSAARAGPEAAALANGTMAHALDFDDVSFSMPGHPSAPVFPAALALAERHGLGGRRVLLAAVLGIETQCKLGRLLNPALARTGWHPTAVLGALGAAACGGVLLGLGDTQLAHALGVACSLAGGVKANFGSMTKPLHVGAAARSGVMACLLARDGWTAGPDALDGRFGLTDCLASARGVEGLADTFANPFDVLSPGIRFKKYPSCAGTHAAIDAMAELAAAHDLRPEQVRRIRCSVAPFVRRVAAADSPAGGLEGKFSVPFCLAAWVLHRKLTPEHFRDETVAEPRARELMAKVEMAEDPALSPDGFSGSSARVEVVLAGGRTLSATRIAGVEEGAAALTEQELIDKFRGCVEPPLGAGRAAAILRAVQGFAESARVDELMGLLGPP